MKNTFALKGTIVQADGPQRLAVCEGYAVCENGVCAGTFAALPGKYAGLPVADYTGKLVVPGLVDLHVHAPQYAYRGTAMDLELLDWLDRYTFPEEAHYADAQYAQKGYADFVQAIKNTATTRAVVFGTLHTDATLTLMRLLDAAGMAGFVGKVAMDRNSPDNYREPSAEAGLAETRRWLDAWHGDAAAANGRVHPILTPRFTPSVTPGYMRGLGELAAARHLPVQSHLSENPKEIEWVQALEPDCHCYGETYARYALFGGATPTVMAHCVWSEGEEAERMLKNGVFVAHCPTSNENLGSGIAPAARFLRQGYAIGLGSDVAGGHTLDLFAVMRSAIQMSKLRWRYVEPETKPLTMPEAFYMATAGGGAFFDAPGLPEAERVRVGRLAEGYAFDAAVLDDAALATVRAMTPAERLERWVYTGGAPSAKYVGGQRVL